jgi:hypothetical protein
VLHNVADHLVAQFWTDVRRRLVDVHQQPPHRAESGIALYREKLESHGVGDTLYNQGVNHTAAAVNALIDKPR